MSSIPPNLIGAIFQAQVSAAETARNNDLQRNKRAADSRELARLADQTTSEVEDTDQTEDVIVRRQDERRRDGQDARDTWEHHQRQEDEPEQKLYTPAGPSDDPADTAPEPDTSPDSPPVENNNTDPPPEDLPPHIDISA